MDHKITTKTSKIPVLKKAKMLRPIKNKKQNESSCYKNCPSCCELRQNVSVLEQNMATLLKENNFLRQQLSLSGTNIDLNDPKESAVISLAESDIEDNSFYCISNSTHPFYLLTGHSFGNFDVNLLCYEMDYSHSLSSRKVKFYGDAPYRYGDTLHEPCPIPSNSYLLKIVEQVSKLFPQYSFNSVLCNQYDDGNSHIPMHADDEAQIKSDSEILTISLGDTRTIKFQPKKYVQGSETSITLQHGDVFIMSSASQKLFKHGIRKEFGKGMRISLTFRDLVHPIKSTLNSSIASTDISLDLSAIDTTVASTPSAPIVYSPAQSSAPPLNPIPCHLTDRPSNTLQAVPPLPKPIEKQIDTILISSSMFADLNEAKLSSDHHRVKVFFYRGATAGGILKKLQKDPTFLNLNPGTIKQVFMLCGTNDVDTILNIQKPKYYNVNVNSNDLDMLKFERSINDIHNLVDFIHSWSNGASVNILNLLPRCSVHRNNVINKINHFLRNICSQLNYLNFIDTEYKLYLFSDSNGYRKSLYFKQIGTDNVHLNGSGVLRFGKHIKYLLHLDSPRKPC